MNKARLIIAVSGFLFLGRAFAAAPVVQSSSASSVAASQAALTDDTLQKMLDAMGYEPKKLSKGYLIAIKRDSWTFNMQLTLSSDMSKLGFNANLGVVSNPQAVTAAQWMALLVSNKNIDPSSFYFDDEQKKLYIHRVLDNRGIAPAFLRQQIENFCGNMKDTAELWKFTD